MRCMVNVLTILDSLMIFCLIEQFGAELTNNNRTQYKEPETRYEYEYDED